MIRRIAIKGFKSFSEFEMRMGPLMVIAGANGSGKSNFLDAIDLLSRFATRTQLHDALDDSFRGRRAELFHTTGGDSLRPIGERQNRSFSITVDIELSDASIREVQSEARESVSRDPRVHRYLRYRLHVAAVGEMGHLAVLDESLVVTGRDGLPKANISPLIERVADHIMVSKERGGSNSSVRLPMHSSYTALSKVFPASTHPTVNALQREFSRFRFFYLEPRFKMRLPSQSRIHEMIGPAGEDLAGFLFALSKERPRMFEAICRALHTMVPHITTLDTEVNPMLGEVELFIVEGHERRSARLASEGTIRMIAFLAMAAVPERIPFLAFEEPENGIHPARIGHLCAVLDTMVESGMQVVLTTHSREFAAEIRRNALFRCYREEGETQILPMREWAGEEFDIPSVLNAEPDSSVDSLFDVRLSDVQ